MEVTYKDHLGDDLRVVNAARVSFAKESEWEWVNDGAVEWVEDENGYLTPIEWPTEIGVVRNGAGEKRTLSERDQKLIHYLATHNHWTPFSHCQITLVEKVPLFVARQRFKHMVGFTYNEVSRRYVDDAPEVFWPDVWRRKAENKKQGSSDIEVKLWDIAITGEGPRASGSLSLADRVINTTEDALDIYDALLKAGVAPEQARMVLPQSMYTEYYVTGSLAAFARAYKLRSDPHAQKEIQDLATKWDEIIRPLFPVSWAALVD